MKLLLSTLLFSVLLFGSSVKGQTHDRALHFSVTGAEDTVIYLASYYGSKLYYNDTTRSDSRGNFVFKAKERPAGKYAVVVPGPRYFEIILADGDPVNIKTDTTDFRGDMNVVKSKNNKALYEYVHYLNEKKKDKKKLQEKAKTISTDKKKKKLTRRMTDLNKDVRHWQEDYVDRYSDIFAGEEVNLTLDVDVPDSLENDRVKGYNYYRDHFWERTRLSDDRLVHSPLFAKRFDRYMNKVLLQNPDTMTRYMDRLIARVDKESEMFKYMVHTTTYNFEKSKVMGMDKGFVHMVDKYYSTGDAYWMDSTRVAKITDRAHKIKPLLIGKKSPNLILPDSTGKWINLYTDVHSKYTLLFFFDPDCSHCKKATPKLLDYYHERGKDQGLEVYTTTTDAEKDKWEQFLIDYKMGDFTNTAVPQKAYENKRYATRLVSSGITNLESLNYQDTFDVFSTPTIILLDKNKKIIAKQLGVEQIGDFIERYEKRQKKIDETHTQ